MNSNNVKKRIRAYVKDLGYSIEIQNRFVEMYFKEVDHIVEMDKRAKKLEPFKRMFQGKEYSNNTFEYKNEDELFYKSVNSVNASFNMIFKGN